MENTDIYMQDFCTIDTLPSTCSSLSTINTIKKTSRIQTIRSTSITQHNNNPFKKKNTASMPHSSEFINYKPIESDVIQEEIVDHQTTSKKIEALKAGSDLSVGTLRDMENEVRLELLMGSYISTEMEKELKILSKLKPVLDDEVLPKVVKLPPSTKKNTLILDLDETLIHMLLSPSFKGQDMKNVAVLSILDKSKTPTYFQIVKRPYLELFLKSVATLFELIVNSLSGIYCIRKKLC